VERSAYPFLLILKLEKMSNQKNKDVVLRVEDKKQHGKTIILPLAGEVTLDENGEFTIDDVTATLLLNQGRHFTLVKGNGTTVTEEETEEEETEEEEENDDDNDSDKEEDNDSSDDEEETEEEETEEEEDGLESLELAELIEIAAKSFKEEEYKKFKKSKKMMISFLRKNS
jgi:hypothetical protein